MKRLRRLPLAKVGHRRWVWIWRKEDVQGCPGISAAPQGRRSFVLFLDFETWFGISCLSTPHSLAWHLPRMTELRVGQ